MNEIISNNNGNINSENNTNNDLKTEDILNNDLNHNNNNNDIIKLNRNDNQIIEEESKKTSSLFSNTTTSSLPPPLLSSETIKLENTKNTKSNECEDDFGEEEIIDGFAILTFKYLKDLKREYENRKRKHNDKINTIISSSSSSSSSTTSSNDSCSVISSSSSNSSTINRRKNIKNSKEQSISSTSSLLKIEKTTSGASTTVTANSPNINAKNNTEKNKDNLKHEKKENDMDVKLHNETKISNSGQTINEAIDNEENSNQRKTPNITCIDNNNNNQDNNTISLNETNDCLNNRQILSASPKTHSVTNILHNKTVVNDKPSITQTSSPIPSVNTAATIITSSTGLPRNDSFSKSFMLNSLYSQDLISSSLSSLNKPIQFPLESQNNEQNFSKLILDLHHQKNNMTMQPLRSPPIFMTPPPPPPTTSTQVQQLSTLTSTTNQSNLISPNSQNRLETNSDLKPSNLLRMSPQNHSSTSSSSLSSKTNNKTQELSSHIVPNSKLSHQISMNSDFHSTTNLINTNNNNNSKNLQYQHHYINNHHLHHYHQQLLQNSPSKLEGLSNNELYLYNNKNTNNNNNNNNNNNSVNKQQQKQTNNELNDSFLQNSNTLKNIKSTSTHLNNNDNIYSSQNQQLLNHNQYHHQHHQHQKDLLNNSNTSQYKEIQTKQSQNIESNKTSQKHTNSSQNRQSMYATSTSKLSLPNSFDSYTTDFLKRDLNSRFLQTTNNFSDNNHITIPKTTASDTTTTNSVLNNNDYAPSSTNAATNSIFNSLMHPYLRPDFNINSHEANLFTSQPLFTQLIDSNKLPKSINLDNLMMAQYLKHNAIPPPTTPIAASNNNNTLSSSLPINTSSALQNQLQLSGPLQPQNNSLISSFIHPSPMQSALLNNTKSSNIVSKSSIAKEKKHGKWCSAHIKIAHMILNYQKQNLNKHHSSQNKDSNMKSNEKKNHLIQLTSLPNLNATNSTTATATSPATFFTPLFHSNQFGQSLNPSALVASQISNDLSNDSLHKPIIPNVNSFGGLGALNNSNQFSSTYVSSIYDKSDKKDEKIIKRHGNISNHNHHNYQQPHLPNTFSLNDNQRNNTEIHRSKHEKSMHHHGHHRDNQQKVESRSRSRSPLIRSGISNQNHFNKEDIQMNSMSSHSYNNSSHPFSNNKNVDLYEKYRQDFYNNTLQLPTTNATQQYSLVTNALLNPHLISNNSFTLPLSDLQTYTKMRENNDKLHLQQERTRNTPILNNYPYFPARIQNILPANQTSNSQHQNNFTVPTNNSRANETLSFQSLLPNEAINSFERETLIRNGGLTLANSPYFDPTNPNLVSLQSSLAATFSPYHNLSQISQLTPQSFNQLNINNLLNKNDSKQPSITSTTLKSTLPPASQSQGSVTQPQMPTDNFQHHNVSFLKKNNSIGKLKHNISGSVFPLITENQSTNTKKSNPNEVIIIKDDSNEQTDINQETNNHNNINEFDKLNRYQNGDRIQKISMTHQHNHHQKHLMTDPTLMSPKTIPVRPTSNTSTCSNNGTTISTNIYSQKI